MVYTDSATVESKDDIPESYSVTGITFSVAGGKNGKVSNFIADQGPSLNRDVEIRKMYSGSAVGIDPGEASPRHHRRGNGASKKPKLKLAARAWTFFQKSFSRVLPHLRALTTVDERFPKNGTGDNHDHALRSDGTYIQKSISPTVSPNELSRQTPQIPALDSNQDQGFSQKAAPRNEHQGLGTKGTPKMDCGKEKGYSKKDITPTVSPDIHEKSSQELSSQVQALNGIVDRIPVSRSRLRTPIFSGMTLYPFHPRSDKTMHGVMFSFPDSMETLLWLADDDHSSSLAGFISEVKVLDDHSGVQSNLVSDIKLFAEHSKVQPELISKIEKLSDCIKGQSELISKMQLELAALPANK